MARFAYILLHQAAGLNPGPRCQEVSKAMAEVERRLRIKMWSWPVFTKQNRSRKWANHRIFFTAPTERDDSFAARLAENILLLCELFYGPLYTMTDRDYAFPFRLTRFKNNAGITSVSLSREVRSALNDSHLIFVDQLIQTFSGIPDEIVAHALRAAPLLHEDERLRMATAFISKAQHDFYVYPGQLQEAIHEGDWFPSGAYELAQWEAAFHNSYKAVEAIVGDPPKDDERFCSKLSALGINPLEEVGYTKKEAIWKVVKDMNHLRDTRVAHGSTPKRGIRLNQMVEFTECANYVVQRQVERAYGGNFYD